jgi:hypothetical protein
MKKDPGPSSSGLMPLSFGFDDTNFTTASY